MTGARFKTYPAYKDSGIEWLGEIPAHWEIRRLKDHGAFVGGAGFPHECQGVVGEDLQFYKVGDLRSSSDGRKMLEGPNSVSRDVAAKLRAPVIPAGAILWAKIGAALFLNRRRVTTRPCCIDNNLTAYIPDGTHVSTDWALYWTSSLDFRRLANPGAVPSLSEGYQSTLPLVAPPMDEQYAIVGFLDRETAKIDALVEKKERLIELLQEKRTALITHAVTQGLDPNVPMGDSGIEWLGQIPMKWEVVRVKNVATMQAGVAITSESIEETGEYPVYGGNGLRGYTSSFTHAGDVVLIGRQGALCGNVNYASGEFWASEHAVVVEPLDGTNVCWLGETLRSMKLNDYSVAAAQPGLAVDRILALSIAVPPKDEQHRIADFLDRETAKIDALISKVQEAIERLKEYRIALISAAVTGKIDVRESTVDPGSGTR